MASSSRQMLMSCSSRESGCWIFFRRATTVGCSAVTQKRSVATVCLRRERSRRYSATTTVEIEPNSAANWTKLRFRKNTALLDYTLCANQRSEDHVLDRHAS